MEIQLYLKRPDSLTPTGIFARISFEGGRFKYYLPEKIDPLFWNTKTHRAKESRYFPEYPEFNARLDNSQQMIKTVYRKYLNDNGNKIPSIEVFKDGLDKAFGKTDNRVMSFMEYFRDFTERSERGERISPKTKSTTCYNTNKGYITTLNHLEVFLKGYKRRVDFETVNLEFYNDYVKHLTSVEKLGVNTIGDHIKRIKTVLGEAKSKGIIVNSAFESGYFTKPEEETDSIYLTAVELSHIEKLDLSGNSKLDRVRDLFLLGCFTGLRYSDFSKLKAGEVIEGYIHTTQAKTGKPIVIPVHPIVNSIIKKYKGNLPASISNQKTNEYIKELCGMVPELKIPISTTYTKGGVKITKTYDKWELVTTHTARRSFATNEYLAGTPAITIMAITGHRTEKAFLKYIKLSANEHAKLLKMHWDKRLALKIV